MKKIILVLTILASIAAVSCNSKQAPTIGDKPLTTNVPSDDKTKREGTPAAKMEDSISDEEKHKRLDRLNVLVDKYYLEGNKRFEGQVVNVLVDGVSKNNLNNLCGYSENLKLVHFPSTDKSLIGQIVKVKIIEGKTWFALGELVNE